MITQTKLDEAYDRIIRECKGEQPKPNDPGYPTQIYYSLVDRYNDYKLFADVFLYMTEKSY